MMDRKQGWMFVVEIILICGIFLTTGMCQSSCGKAFCPNKNILFISTKENISTDCYFPSDVIEVNGVKLCFNFPKMEKESACCQNAQFNCNYNISYNKNDCQLIFKKEILASQDIVLFLQPEQHFECKPSHFWDNQTGGLLRIKKCLEKGVKNFRLSQKSLCGNESLIGNEACPGVEPNNYKVTVKEKQMHCEFCRSWRPVLCPEQPAQNDTDAYTSVETALNILQDVSSILEQMNDCSATGVKKGNVRGMITKLPEKDHNNMDFGFTTSDISVLGDNNDLAPELLLLVHISKEASEMAVERNGSFVGVLLIKDVPQNDPSSSILNNEAVGIDMGVKISNLSQTIDVQFRNVEKNGSIASCMSWDGKRKDPVWIKDGCQTLETDGSITCQCSHLTFFAVLLSPPPGNISASDLTALSYITSVGCGLSVFFLAAAIFLHCLFRKRKANQATELLMHLFAAMIALNTSFLTNDKIANLEIFGACVAIAAFMHYTTLATMTWFFMEALHLYFNLRKLTSDIKHYMVKMCVTGWGIPTMVVIPLLALGKYNYIAITADDGTSAKMCWIPDAAVHLGVNIGYYGIVFVFTLSVFILILQQILILRPKMGRAKEVNSIKRNSTSILCLVLLLGITWGFAFFSHGPLLIPSYYIFTILNSFQGFFLFIYYLNSTRTAAQSSSLTGSNSSNSSTTTSNTNNSSFYQ